MKKRFILSHSPHFLNQALREVERFGPFRWSSLAPGLTEVRLQFLATAMLKKWRHRPPIYVQHSFPWEHTYSTEESLLSGMAARLPKHKAFQLQYRCLGETLLKQDFAAGLELKLSKRSGCRSFGAAELVLSLVEYQGRYLCGLSQRRDNISPWSGGAPPLAPDPGRLNRAEPKLAEALKVFRLKLGRGTALDLGSSQGGWSRVLLGLGFRVTAVDPKGPDLVLREHPALTHHPKTAQQFLEGCDQRFDFISNDMIMWPAESARLMTAYAPLLKPGGSAIMTLKVGCKRRLANADQALRILRRAYKIPRLKQLYHNGQELTAWLKPRIR